MTEESAAWPLTVVLAPAPMQGMLFLRDGAERKNEGDVRSFSLPFAKRISAFETGMSNGDKLHVPKGRSSRSVPRSLRYHTFVAHVIPARTEDPAASRTHSESLQ